MLIKQNEPPAPRTRAILGFIGTGMGAFRAKQIAKSNVSEKRESNMYARVAPPNPFSQIWTKSLSN
jgi:hypothetical protein